MSATLLSFTRRAPGWDSAELALLIRVERLLAQAGLDVEMEHGLTEEGDPWCVFCAGATGEVVIHVARIDGLYVLDSTTLPGPIEGRSLLNCAERFLEQSPALSAPRPMGLDGDPAAPRPGAKLYTHPSAMLAGVFMTIMLFARIHEPVGQGAETETLEEAPDGFLDALLALLADPREAAAEGAEALQRIAQQVQAFLAAEARQAERNADAAAPVSAWVMLQSAAMIATLAIIEQDKLVAALIHASLGAETAEVAEEGPELAAAAEPGETGAPEGETRAATPLPAEPAGPETPEEAARLEFPATGDAAGADEAVAGLFRGIEGHTLAAGADTLAGTAGADMALPSATPSPATPPAAAPEATGAKDAADTETATEAGGATATLADRVIDALIAAGARELQPQALPDGVETLIDDFLEESVFGADSFDYALPEPARPDPEAPGDEAALPRARATDVGGEAVRETVAGAQETESYDAHHLRIEEDLFREIVDDVAGNGKRQLLGGNVVWFDDQSSQRASVEDVLLLSVEKADESLLILVTYAASPALEDWLAVL